VSAEHPHRYDPKDIAHLIELGRAGNLTDEYARAFLHKYKNVFAWEARDKYAREVSPGLLTLEYFDALARLFHGRTVLNLGTTTGVLSYRMNGYGTLTWRTNREGISQELEKGGYDAIFMNFPPEESRSYLKLLSLANCPIVILTDIQRASWLGKAIRPGHAWKPDSLYVLKATQVMPDFVDIPNWHGMTWATYIVMPAGVVYEISDGVVVAGPAR